MSNPLEDHIAGLDALTERLLSGDYGTGNAQQTWSQPHVRGSELFQQKNRIFAGGTGDTAQRDTRGNITGYKARSGGSLTPGLDAMKSGTNTPGLDAFHAMQKGVGGGPHSWDSTYTTGGSNSGTTPFNGLDAEEKMSSNPTAPTFNPQSSIRPLPGREAGGLVNRVSFPSGINPPATGGESGSTWAGIQSGNANLYRPADTRPPTAAPALTWNRTGWNQTSNPAAIASQYKTPVESTAQYAKQIFS